MKIIAFSGKKQSGKTTAVKFLKGKLDKQVCSACGNGKDVAIINFADELKRIVMHCFDDTIDFDSDESKNKVLACGKKAREILQILGTDFMRNQLWEDCWVTAYKNDVHNWAADIVLTTDVRFPNEVKCIQDLGGHVIRLLRTPFPDDKHESETALDSIPLRHNGISIRLSPDHKEMELAECGYIKCKEGFDAMIDNSDMSIEQQNEAVWKLVKEKKWI